MIPYDPARPLFFIHVPKAGGSSVRALVQDWFGTGFLPHYPDEVALTGPVKWDLGGRPGPVVVYGHCNRDRGFGMRDYYPDAGQFATVLRDPLELAISQYFYLRAVGDTRSDKWRIPRGDLEAHLRTATPNMLQHFPRPVTADNYRDVLEEHFVAVGITERLDASMARIAAALGFDYAPGAVGHLNASPRDQALPDSLRDWYREAHRLEYLVYDHVRATFPDATLPSA